MNRHDTRRLLVCYDIPSDARRLRLSRVLESYGDRVQYSVFVIDAPPVILARMRRKVEHVIEPAEDSVLFCDLGLASGVEDSRFVYVGAQRPITGTSSFIL
jgi:CRISPR-associated protein Cas2